jgi:sec-independent protein translocase protein TatA
MDFFSIWHWLIVGAVLLLVFGRRGQISEVMGDVAKGIKTFKKGMSDTTEEAPPAGPIRIADDGASADNQCPTESQSEV